MMMHDGPSGLLSSCDLRIVASTKNGDSSMVKQHQTDFYSYSHPHNRHHNQSIHHSESSRSSSISSSSLSPKTSSLTVVASSTNTSSATVTPVPCVTAAFSDIDPKLAQDVEYELGLTKKNGGTSGTRKNAWGNLSYAELISKAITSSAEQRLTLSEIYDWMIKYVPFFRNKVDRASSAGWKNSIRHNLSLHNRFKRVQSEGSGKSSWWMINPDEKLNGNGNSSTPTSGQKQSRRRLGQSVKVPSTPTVKRPRTTKSTKASKTLMSHGEQDNSSINQSSVTNEIPVALYDTQRWTNPGDSEMISNHLYEQDLYSPSVNTTTTNSSINSVGCIPSTYTYDDVPNNYPTNNSSTNTSNNDYAYHHAHHYHHSHPQSLFQHHHSTNYEMNSNNGYYLPQQQPQRVLHSEHSTNPCSLSIDAYHPTTNNSYALSQITSIDPNDEQSYLRVHSASSHSSTASLSPPTLSTNSNIVPSSSSGSSSSNYSHSQKSSTTGGYLHPSANGTVTLYSHHHQPHITHLAHSHPSEVTNFLQFNIHDDIENDEEDDDLSTLVHHHHHELIDDRQALPPFYSNTIEQRSQLHSHHLIHSNNDGPTSILRTVLHRPIVDMQNHQV